MTDRVGVELPNIQVSLQREHREYLHGHRGIVVWMTGLSASGKTTLARCLEWKLFALGASTVLLDGDAVRRGLCQDLGFTEADRSENIRRIAEVLRLFVDAGVIALCAFISPSQRDRDYVRDLIGGDRFFQIYVNCPLSVCEQRDPKGLYQRARLGLLSHFTGISACYEPPVDPTHVVHSASEDPDFAASNILDLLQKAGVFMEKEILRHVSGA